MSEELGRLNADRKPDEFAELQAYATHSREPFFAIAREYCTPGDRVLDVGAGDGTFARSIEQCEVHVLDGNPKTIEGLKAQFPHVHLHNIPEPFPFENGYFNVIHCSHLIEHLQPQDVYDLLREMDRCLTDRGTIIISAPLMWSGFYDDLSHVRPYPPSVLRKYLVYSSRNRTRQGISTSYQVVGLKYRYNRVPIDYFDLSYSRRWPKRFMFRLVNLLRRIHFTRYEQSGYTIVIQKQESQDTPSDERSHPAQRLAG